MDDMSAYLQVHIERNMHFYVLLHFCAVCFFWEILYPFYVCAFTILSFIIDIRTISALLFFDFQVSREQHRRIKSTVKNTSNSIQLRSLINVLGNLEALHVRPFEIFEEEERQKLQSHWLVYYFC